MKKLSEKITYTGKWICLKESIFLTKRGKKITWESIERATVKEIYNSLLKIETKTEPSEFENKNVILRTIGEPKVTSFFGSKVGN